MTRIASLAVHQLSLSQTLATQQRLVDLQMQVASGKVSRDYRGVAIDSRRLINMETAVAEAEGFGKNIDVTDSRLQLMENAIAGSFDIASRLRDLLVNALNIENGAQLSLNQRAKDMIVELAGLLNVHQDNRHLFSGSRIGVAPIDTSTLLSPDAPLVDAEEFTGAATDSGAGITGLTGIVGVQVESGNSSDAFQLEYDDTSQTFTVTNLNGGASDTFVLASAPAPGETTEIEFDVGGERVVLTIDENFDIGTAIATDTITGNVGAGTGAFGATTLTDTSGDISQVDQNTVETAGTAANATLTLSSADGNFEATGVDLSAPGTVPVTLTNATTGASIALDVNVATGLDDAAIADAGTEIDLANFLENVAATNGTVNTAEARPGDPGYDADNPSFYMGDSTKLTARIDVNATVEYGITADEPGLEKLFRALFMVSDAKVTSSGMARDDLESALGLVIEAMDEIPDIRSKIGSDRLAIDQMKSRHSEFVLFAKEMISEIEDVDVAEAVARISTEQTHLEASYMLTARLSQLTLAKFLR